MTISFRRVVDKAKADSKAAFFAAPKGPVGRQTPAKPYVKPSELQAFRLLHKLTQWEAAKLLGYQVTWWNWRENGALLMPPEMFAKAVAAAGPPPGDQLTPEKKRATQEERIAALEQRVEALEAKAKLNDPALPQRIGASLI